jgi:Uma2 family endonuclease
MRSANRVTREKLLTRTGEYTFEDFCVLVQDGEKADLIDGIIYMASPDNLDAGELFLWLAWVLGGYVEEKNLGRVFGSRIAFRLSKNHAPEPDIAFVVKSRLHLARKGFFEGRPDLAIEIVSPESARRDYLLKRRQYQRFKVPEYWVIDEDRKTATVLRLDAHGKYREVSVRGGVLRSQVIKGLWVRLEWLWQDTRPGRRDALAQVLAGL